MLNSILTNLASLIHNKGSVSKFDKRKFTIHLKKAGKDFVAVSNFLIKAS